MEVTVTAVGCQKADARQCCRSAGCDWKEARGLSWICDTSIQAQKPGVYTGFDGLRGHFCRWFSGVDGLG